MVLEINSGFEIDVLDKDFDIIKENVSIIKDTSYDALCQVVHDVIEDDKESLTDCKTVYFADSRTLNQIAFKVIYEMREKGELPETLMLMVEGKEFAKYYDNPDESGEGPNMDKIREIADAIKLDFNEYIIKTANPITIPDDECLNYKRLTLSDHITYNENTGEFC